MMAAEKQALKGSGEPAIDLSHHISTLAKARQLSPLKGLQKYWGKPGLISMAGGMPDPAYFPFASISGEALVPESFPQTKPPLNWFWSMFGAASTEKTTRMTVPKYAAHSGDVDLNAALQYTPATGLKPLQDFVREFTGKVYQPAYSDWTTLIDVGNTDGISKAISTLCNPGEYIIVEEWTYPSALASALPMGVHPASVKVDGVGLSDVDLERVLSGWDETARGAKRPHVMYTVPIGQNPTGSTMTVERKKAIYEVCVKYDILIVEDDPYYFLQEGNYITKSERAKSKPASRYTKGEDEQTRFINSLTPSFVRFDYQGRVIRLDSFSKIIAPGTRMGWFTCNPLFAERFERQGETTTAAPSGFSQSLVAQLLSKHWGMNNFIRWLQGLQTQYTIRRDFLVDCLFEEFELRRSADTALFGADAIVYTAYTKTASALGEKRGAAKLPLFSFVPPSAGMFLWLKFHVVDNKKSEADGETLEEKIWTDLAENGLLLGPGNIFAAVKDESATAQQYAHFRLSFSLGKFEDMQKGIKILARVLNKYLVQ